MQQKLSHCDEFSLLARTFGLERWIVTLAFRLSGRTAALDCFRTRRLGSLHDNSGLKPKLPRG